MTRFLSNDSLWGELTAPARAKQTTRAAVAYVGKGGAKLLALKQGDTLVVNLSLRTVKQGATSPKEIQKLIRRGVQVFTRSNLHAKFFIRGRTLLVGSANISNHSRNALDEAALFTTDKVALRRAADFFKRLCTEPVRPEYLEKCLKAYRPPLMSAARRADGSGRQPRVSDAKLWFIGNLQYLDLPETERRRIDGIGAKAREAAQLKSSTKVDYIHYPTKPSYFKKIRVGDWIVTCFHWGNGRADVRAPQQVLGQKSYSRGHGKRRYLLLSEAPCGGEDMTLSKFRQRIRNSALQLDTAQPPTMAITSIETADSILGLWTPSGRIATRKRPASKHRKQR